MITAQVIDSGSGISNVNTSTGSTGTTVTTTTSSSSSSSLFPFRDWNGEFQELVDQATTTAFATSTTAGGAVDVAPFTTDTHVHAQQQQQQQQVLGLHMQRIKQLKALVQEFADTATKIG